MKSAAYITVLAAVFTAGSRTAVAQDVLPRATVCLRNPGVIPREALVFAEQRLWRLEKRLGTTVRVFYSDCPDPRALSVTFVDNPSPPHPADALATIRAAGSNILPDTQLFLRSIAALLRNPSDENQGRALGYIIAHELFHYLKQTRHHDGSALNCEYLTENQLLDTR